MSRLTILACGLLLTAGCGSSNIGTVTGTVTMDGEPLKGAMVEFFPKAGGGASSGMTNGQGEYELRYSRDVMGAEKGEHLVQIYTGNVTTEEGDYSGARAETVPAKYNQESELSATVSGGSNVLDFDLDSQGEIIQPLGDTY